MPARTKNKPWALHGREEEIYRYREDQGLTFEEIAVLVKASKQGVQGAYDRHVKRLEAEKKEAPGSDKHEGQLAQPPEDGSSSARAKDTASPTGDRFPKAS